MPETILIEIEKRDFSALVGVLEAEFRRVREAGATEKRETRIQLLRLRGAALSADWRK